jgi:transcriptional regulator with XRE-family HTH domain
MGGRVDHGREVPVGQRIRELRQYRGLSQRIVAPLAGITFGYLGQIERGEKPVNNRQLLEALARALKVHPGDLSRSYVPVDPQGNEAHASLGAIESILTKWWPGEVPDDAPARPWGEAWAELTRLVDVLRPKSEYGAMAADPNNRRTWLAAGKCSRLSVWVGKDAASSSTAGAGRFVVKAEDVETASADATITDSPQHIDIDITGVVRLTLFDTRASRDANNAWGSPLVYCTAPPGNEH